MRPDRSCIFCATLAQHGITMGRRDQANDR